ncbi:MAG: TIGR00282 family metallophosphoesterase [Pseudomonadota bacterium]
MKLAYFGDVVGKSGRQAVVDHLPGIRARLALDFVIVNGENAAGGFGITEAIANDIFAAGADCITLGDHAWDQREAMTYIEREDRLLRPLNYPGYAPGKGSQLYTTPDGRRVGVVQVQGNVFMRQQMANPFIAVDGALADFPIGTVADAVIVDLHCEATSEKMAMGHHCDGRVSLVVGSHTHVPTADTMILENGTAFQSDAGMCGDYDSVIGMKKEISIRRFETQLPGERFQPASGEGTLCGIYVETDDATGLATRAEPVRMGGRLSEITPE